MLLNDVKPDEIFVRAEDNVLVIVDYKKSKKTIHSFSEKQELNLEKLRKNRKDDMQAICAVHESGHAIISMIVLKTLPEMIYSVTAGSDSKGFVYTSFQWNYTSKEEIVKRIAMFLGVVMPRRKSFSVKIKLLPVLARIYPWQQGWQLRC